MKLFVMAALSTLLALTLLMPASQVARAEETTCVDFLGAVTVDNLRVAPNSVCTLDGTTVKGTLKVENGATLDARQIHVVGNIQAEGAFAVTVTDSTVGGSIQLKQGGSATLDQVRVTGDIQWESNQGALSATRNVVGGNLQVFQNTGGAAILDNRIDGNLQCKENNPAPTGGRNQAASFEDQCAGFQGTPTDTPPVTNPTPGDDDFVCRASFEAQTFENLIVPDGASCTLNGTRVNGNIKVGTGATLEAIGVVVIGNIQAEGAFAVTVTDSTIGGSIQIKQGGSATLDQVRVTGDIQLESNQSTLVATGNDVGGNLQAFQNEGGADISNNGIDGNLQCKENNPAPMGGANIVKGTAEDQCEQLATGAAVGSQSAGALRAYLPMVTR